MLASEPETATLPFTVFTPTYNRADKLPRLVASLEQQDEKMFEWLVVDDGSTDGTSELLAQLEGRVPFPMRSIFRANGGKHRAHNIAINAARGELTVILDSDDELAPDALRYLWREWQDIPADERVAFSGVIGNSADETGKIVGGELSFERVDGKFFELVASGAIAGEKLPCYRTDILRRFPFPEKSGNTTYVPEGIVWMAMGEAYRVRCVNRVVRIYHRDARDAGALMNKYATRESNAWGRMRYSLAVLNISGAYWPRFASKFIRAGAAYVRDSLHAGYGIKRQASQLEGFTASSWWLLALPVGSAAWALDRLKQRR
jgi:glycosyltransferase involved in cell wall biosynthesis